MSTGNAKPFEETHLLLPERIEKVKHWRKPRRIFWCSTADMFGEDVPDEYIFEMIRAMTFASWHKHLILTKRIKRAAKLLTPERLVLDTGQQWLDDSIHFGISCSTQDNLDEMAPILFQIPAAHYWLSAEPLLEELDFGSLQPKCNRGKDWQGKEGGYPYLNALTGREHSVLVGNNTPYKFDWVVVGCESGAKRRPCKIEWVRSVVRSSKAAGVAVYVKQVAYGPTVVTDPAKFPADLQIREIPE